MTRIFNVIFLLQLLFWTASSSSYARVFETIQGVRVEGDFVDMKTSGNNKTVVLRLKRTGKLHEIPLSRFSPSDQHFLKFSDLSNRATGKKPATKEALKNEPKKDNLPPPSGNAIAIISSLSSKLVMVNGPRVQKHKTEKAPDYYALYFAASWCHACAQFTPRLREYYRLNIDFAKPKFEIVFISRDNSKAEMENYMIKSKMPWPAISYSDSNRERLVKKYAPRGTPSLVLIDRAGKVISDSAVNGQYRSAFAVKQDIATWFTEGERTASGGIIKSKLAPGKRVSDRR
ncbi:MAG: thioredoxin-like domain-containing protein [Verrucomicrobiota bacterium]